MNEIEKLQYLEYYYFITPVLLFPNLVKIKKIPKKVSQCARLHWFGLKSSLDYLTRFQNIFLGPRDDTPARLTSPSWHLHHHLQLRVDGLVGFLENGHQISRHFVVGAREQCVRGAWTNYELMVSDAEDT